MSIQIRNLMRDSLQHYRNFFNRFSDVRHTPLNIVEKDKSPGNEIEDVFLVVKLKHEGNFVEFADDLEHTLK